MASAHYCVFSLLAPYTNRRTPPRILLSSKIRHRKNYLRPKILKTLTKPYPPTLPLLPPSPQPILCPQEDKLSVEIPANETHDGDVTGVAEEPDELEDLRVTEATAKDNAVFGNVSAADIFKYGGMFFVGAFVFQTICSVWTLGNKNSNQKDGDLEINGKEKRKILLNGNEKTIQLPITGASNVEDQLGMQKKIEEIRLMAREARRIELENKGEEGEDEDSEMDDESAVSSHKLGIEKEIGARLSKLQNRINSNKDSSAAFRINTRGNSAGGVERDVNKNVNQGSEALIFKKKFKFKSPSTKATKTPKGFPGTRDWRASKAKGKDSTDKQLNQQDVVPSEERGEFVDDESNTILNHDKSMEDKMEKLNIKTDVGVKTKITNDGDVQVSKQSGRKPGHSANGSSRQGLAKTKSAANSVKVKQANTKADMWWLNLRYVLVILMQRSSDGGSKGLYSVKFTSKEHNQGDDDSYTVAFEDHADANNFCFLLESFFKDLGDFSADAVPISIQELNDEIISRAKKVVVVKKRQLQLYAGQSLTDVEMALCSVIEDQNVP
ncbi:hypothetical protein VNO77_05724 [Canavalia gladiata]|uniref:Uncharacterized protein n=1 Tax=Canavalia gladiata TaxID=3824 RepID=A0AAN9N443_CANGL